MILANLDMANQMLGQDSSNAFFVNRRIKDLIYELN